MKKANVAIVGLGYVGLPLAILAREKGYNVIGVTRSQEKAKKINKGISPYKDKFITSSLKKNQIFATANPIELKDAEIIIICVPTPVLSKNKPDYRPLISACANIGRNIKKGALVIVESTINPGTIESLLIPELEKRSHMIAGQDFLISHCPERISPGDKDWSIADIPRVVGSINKKGLEKTVRFYQSILNADVKSMNTLKEAEAVKILENSFRDINIAFVNEFAKSFSLLDIDILNVINGASTKPFSFLAHYPGCGVGGHCIPIDPYYMIAQAKNNGFNHKFLSLARSINNSMPQYTVDLLLKKLKTINKDIKNMRVTILGIAYKKDVDDFRASPSFKIISLLGKKGIDVVVYDPYILSKSTANSLDEALKDSDGVIIATDHDLFRKLQPKTFLEKNIKIVIDGRNCLDKEKFIRAGITYVGIGR